MIEQTAGAAGTVMFVDDDADVLTSARVLLSRHQWRLVAARSPAEAWSVLAAERPDVILLDLNFSHGATTGQEGFDWLSQLRAHDPSAVVVVVTGHSGVNVAVRAMKEGASDFVMKPWSNARLVDTVSEAFKLAARRHGRDTAAGTDDELLLGDSMGIRRVRDLVARTAKVDASVLFLGPAGAGKSLAARMVHARSVRASAPLLTLDLRAGIIASEFPAVLESKVNAAAGGALILDEISALTPSSQAELLAWIGRRADVRWMATSRASRDDLQHIRDDLLAELSTVEIILPPLIERDDDALLLMEHFVRMFSRRLGCPPKPLDAAATDLLRSGALPAHVRGLRQAAERAVAISEKDLIGAEDLISAGAGTTRADGGGDLNLARSEKAIVEAALKRHAHNISGAAKSLGLTRAALYRRMVKHGL